MILISLKAKTWVLLGLVIHDASSLSIKAKATPPTYGMKNYLWMKQISFATQIWHISREI